MKLRIASVSLCAVFALTSPQAVAQVDAAARVAFDVELERWRSAHGESWQAVFDTATGHASMLYGGRAPATFRPVDEAGFEIAARLALATTETLHGVDPTTLVPVRALLLPLGQIGTTDKWTVRFRQEVGGVRVDGAYVNVLLDTRGGMLSVQSTALPDTAGVGTHPTISPARARELGLELFAAHHAGAPTRVGEPEIVVAQEHARGRRFATVAWKIDVQSIRSDELPVGYTFVLDARDGRYLHKQRSVHFFDVGGQVTTMATPGVLPDAGANQEVPIAVPHLTVTSSAGTQTTDANGDFNFPGVNTPLDVTFEYSGPFNRCNDVSAPVFSLTQTLQPGPATAVTMNPAAVDTVTAQANAFLGVGVVRDWIRSVNPLDTTADFQAVSNLNIPQSCNAYYDGTSINFYLPGGPCVNTAYSTVVAHEYGHWLNDRYLTFNGGDGMGEGNADIFAMFAYDTPIVGEDFGGAGNAIRTGLNTRMFCGDLNPACHGGVHDDGEVWMGAAWKIRTELGTTHGDVVGDMIADHLFLAWMNGYNQTAIQTVIQAQWLVLDDDDGNLANLTPHYADIDQGFQDQGFPPFVPPVMTIAGVSDLPDAGCTASSYPVSASVSSLIGAPITSTRLYYRVGGAAFSSVPMTAGAGTGWSGAIPGAGSPIYVTYYVEATDGAGNVRTFPTAAPADVLDFTVGTPDVAFADDFETAGPNGWNHSNALGAPNTNDDWTHDFPAGLGGSPFGINWTDPAAPAGGGLCWGNDLGLPGFNGAYQAEVHNYLETAPINWLGKTGTVLRYKRWLTVEQGVYDKARVLVNGVPVWTNAPLEHTIDTGWTTVEHNISALADNQVALTIRWSLQSDGGLELGGWQIDDVELIHFTAAPPCCPQPTTYCAAQPNSAGPGAHVQIFGSTSLALNNFSVRATGGPALRNGFVFYGQGQSQTSFGNGFQCIGGAMFKLPVVVFGSNGIAQSAVNLAAPQGGGAFLAGQEWSFQMVYRDPAGLGAGFNLTDAVRVRFCP